MNDSPEQDRIDYSRIERAIRYLDQQREAQPTLEDVAAHVGLSKYHFHRLFQRWAGVTPKRFLQYLTVEHARSLLERHEPVLATAYEAGLSGPGRLHDHFVQVEAATPGEVSRGGEGLTIRTGIHPTPFGDALLATTERGVCFLAFV
ncbi:MAG: helix-turn-helix domain-containing protein, partial [Gemmatimonadetes bacterium]|nr:helix-turn-helix domain-containing protein [Gemmatimonadota bacterium]NIR81576.1 helix-turn-helix domain-containing protein [Gemmatimonadota bacterium]NIT90417.1 helix-turn-helix domain-containing protein [Gemmatimonadota bacterium]NIU34251.1 helix-turn-helix domain-containing protein [Gemmatimonadota bacterium]NIU38379.1 helix-turn-helix domain-containing protein [Gemmatimonadota bacterium]